MSLGMPLKKLTTPTGSIWRGSSFHKNDDSSKAGESTYEKSAAYKEGPSAKANKAKFFPGHPCTFYPLSDKKMLQWQKTIQETTHDATRSGVSASMDNKAVCTLSNQVSSRSRKDLICGIPKTLGCTQETCTVPSTWSIMPSIRWTWRTNFPIVTSRETFKE